MAREETEEGGPEGKRCWFAMGFFNYVKCNLLCNSNNLPLEKDLNDRDVRCV